VLVIECKNANKDEAIALGVDQIRHYHRETPELFVSQQLFIATDATSPVVKETAAVSGSFPWQYRSAAELNQPTDQFLLEGELHQPLTGPIPRSSPPRCSLKITSESFRIPRKFQRTSQSTLIFRNRFRNFKVK